MIVSLVLATLVIGLIARTVPQMNVFMVALPAKIWIGLFFMGTSLSIMASVVQRHSLALQSQIGMMLKWMGRGG
jgi:flagellar biosynthetic protein FliR